jgi:hypothetical protein
MKDSTLVYNTYSDSSGAYRLPYLQAGGYRLLAFSDDNRNRRYDYTREPGATQITSVIFDPVTTDFAIETADTTAPVFRSAEVADSLTVRLLFDDPLDTLQTLEPEKFTLRTPDSSGTTIPLDSAAFDSRDRTRLLLYPSGALVAGESYHVSVRNIVNRAGLILERGARSFTYSRPKPGGGREGRARP